MNVGAAGAVVAGNGELDGCAGVVDLEYLLHSAFTEGTFARHLGSIVILKTSRHDFAGTSRLIVLQHDDRNVFVQFNAAVGRFGMIEAERRPLVETMRPSLSSMSHISTAALKTPPGLNRKSIIRALAFGRIC